MDSARALHEFVGALDGDDNIVISNHGVCEALSMLEAGAGGASRRELQGFLKGMCGSESKRSDEDGARWQWANVIVHGGSVRLRDAYLRRVAGVGEAIVVDRSRMDQIERLDEIVGQLGVGEGMDWVGGTIAPLRLLSLNAFSGEWGVAFEPDATRPRMFLGHRGTRTPVPMMETTGSFRYVEGDGGLRCAVLDYQVPRFSAVIAFWTDGRSRDIVELLGRRETYAALNAPPTELKVVMPRFSIRRAMSLKGVLIDRGVKSVFRDGQSGLDGMVEGASAPYVDDVLHHAAIEVDESGTRTRSVTAINVIGAAPATEFVVDKPFVFLVVDRDAGSPIVVAAIRRLDAAASGSDS